MKKRGDILKLNDVRFTVAGIKISVSFWFAVIVTFYALVFENSLKVLLAVVLHEAAHMFCVYLFGRAVECIRLHISDINIISDTMLLSKAQKIVICAAGPAANLLAAGLSYLWGDKVFLAVNVVICVFQLIPAAGSDGGEIFILLMGKKFSRLCLLTSLVLSVMLASAGVFMLMKTGYEVSLLIAGLYLLFMTCKERI